MSKYVAEGISSLFVLLIGCTVSAIGYDSVGVLGIAASFAISYALVYYTIGKIYGCYVSPIFSFAAYLSKKISFKEFGFYLIAELAAAILSSVLIFLFIFMLIDGDSILFQSKWICGFENISELNIGFIGGALVEILISTILVFAFCVLFFSKEKKVYCGIVFSAVVAMVIIFSYNLTGACWNPARSLSAGLLCILFGSTAQIIQFPIFLIAHILGSLAGVLVYKLFYKTETADIRLFSFANKLDNK